MKTRIHVNQHVVKRNAKTGEREPVLTCKTSKSNTYGHEVSKVIRKLYTVQTNHYHVVLKFG